MTKISRLTAGPLIGLFARIAEATNSSLHRISGRIVDETHGTLTLFDGARRRIILKEMAIFDITFPNNVTLQVAGSTLVGHPAERLRRAKRLRW